MRTPSLTVAEAEAALGVRGHTYIKSENVGAARKWLTARGLRGDFAQSLNQGQIGAVYNDTTDSKFQDLAARESKWLANRNGNGGVVIPEGDIVANVPVPPQNDAQTQIHRIAALLGELLAKPAVDPDMVRDIVRKEIAGLEPREIVIRNADKPVAQIDGIAHPCFERVLRLVAGGANVLLVGPAGCGKTTMAAMIAKALNANYGAIHGSAGASESALTGWLLPADGGRFEYTASLFITLYEEGESLFLFDELDAFDPNMLLVVNGALDNGHIFVAHRTKNPRVNRGTNTRMLATANTYGTSANPMYAGRNPLDTATLNRFIVVTMDYDRRLEESIGKAGGLEAHEMADIWNLRDKVRTQELRRCISTRAFKQAVIMKAAGDSWATVKATLVEGWTADEKAQVGMG